MVRHHKQFVLANQGQNERELCLNRSTASTSEKLSFEQIPNAIRFSSVIDHVKVSEHLPNLVEICDSIGLIPERLSAGLHSVVQVQT